MTPAETAARDDDLAALLMACDEVLAGGAVPSALGDGGVPAADQARLKRDLACVQLLRQAWPRATAATGPSPPAGEAAPLPLDRLGRFEILRELGRGGFGVVYLARDPQLGRDVALKVPRTDAPFPADLRARFQQEARAAAGLDHPNLVPVYEAGEVGPVCYIASAYCPGISLAQWLRGRDHAVPCADAARLVLTLARAVHHAHERGIVHRDLKPANILLVSGGGVSGESSPATLHPSPLTPHQPKITDFGLAKFVGSDAGLTQSGALLGTPCYMAPEQAEGRGKAVGPGVDVYALGVILYEVLTGRPPFQADSAVATLLLVRREEPLPPGRLRPKLPRDLEAVCLKCLEKVPERRYASAAALADDLQRHLDGRPTRARPVGPWGRVWRWGARRPAVAALLATLALVVAGSLAGLVAQERQARRERDAAVRERGRAEHHLQKAREAVDRLIELGEKLCNVPDQEASGRAVLDQALGFYEDFLGQSSDDPAVRYQAAVAGERVAYLRHLRGEWDQADAAFRASIRLLEGLRDDPPPGVDVRFRLAGCHLNRANLLRDVERHDEAGPAYRRAQALFEEVLAETPTKSAAMMGLASTFLNGVHVRGSPFGGAEMEALYARAAALQERALAAEPGRPAYRLELAISHDAVGQMFWDRGDRAEAEKRFRAALAVYRDLVAEGMTAGRLRTYRARSHAKLGLTLAATGQPDDAEKEYREAVRLLEAHLADAPGLLLDRRDLAGDLGLLADHLTARGRPAAAEPFHRKAAEQWETLAARSPQAPVHRLALADRRYLLGTCLMRLNRHPEAAAELRRALDLRPESSGWANELAWALVSGPDPASWDPGRALPAAQKAVLLDPKRPTLWNTLGVVYCRGGRWTEGAAALERAMALGGGDSFDWFFLAMACHHLGESRQARAWYDRAVSWMAKHRPDDPELRRFRAEAKALLRVK